MSTQLVINADDFGRVTSVNSAVVEARKGGVLTSASLMVTGEAVDEAVSIAQNNPELAVGLHLTLSHGKSILQHDVIPDLVNEDSHFIDSPAAAGFKYYFDPRLKSQLEMEIEAQFQTFIATGLPLSHVDGHQHLHVHPSVLPIVVEYALRYGAHGIRVPFDPFGTNMQVDRSRLMSKAGVALGHAFMARKCRRVLSKTSLVWCDAAIGSLMSGRMNSDYVIGMLRNIKYETIELFFHPSLVTIDASGPNPGDLVTLLDPEFHKFLEEGNYILTNYPEIARGKAESFGSP